MQSPITQIGAMLAEPARAKMLLALLSGKALTATELALEADITAQTASSHLAKLLDAGMIKVEKQGRHKYFQLSNQQTAQLLENMLVLTSTPSEGNVKTGPSCPSLRQARVCYDHIAGTVGVQLFDHFEQHTLIRVEPEGTFLTAKGEALFAALGSRCRRHA